VTSTPAAVAIHRELATRGPLTMSQMLTALSGRDIDYSEHDLDDLADDGIPLVTDVAIREPTVYVALDAVLRGRVLTHRLTEADIESDTIPFEPDLTAFAFIAEEPPFDHLESGAAVRPKYPADLRDLRTSLDVPTGTLAGYRPGDLIGLSLGPDHLRLRRVNGPADAPTDLAARAAELSEVNPGEPVELYGLILQLCIDDPDLFTDALPPLGELLEGWGLELTGSFVAAPGFDYQTHRTTQNALILGYRYGIDEDEALAVSMLSQLYGQFAEGSGALDDLEVHRRGAQGAVRLLADSQVAEALFDETVANGVDEARALVALLESLEPIAPRQSMAALRWLRGMCRERLGEVAPAESDFEQSLAADPCFLAALMSLARYAEDRGDAVRAISLLRRAGLEDSSPLIEELAGFVPAERADVGRNDPCWCGSGRKYKRCHLGRVELSPHDRATWLFRKAVNYLDDGPHLDLHMDLAAIRGEHQLGQAGTDDDDTDDELDDELMGDPTVIDVALFDGGVLEEFLRVRGALLPEVEQLMLTQWLTVDRSVFEVTELTPGRGLTVLDIRTGDRHELADKALSRSVHLGDLICTRLLPVGDTVEIFGGVDPVPVSLLDATLAALDRMAQGELDADEAMEVLSARFVPPTLVTGEGEPLVLCTAVFDTPPADLDRLTTALDDAYEPADAGSWLYTVPGEEAAGGQWILASMMIDGTTLTVESNAARRFDEVLDTVRATVPNASLTSETRVAAGDLIRQPGGERTVASGELADPATAELLRSFTADYETRWLDMELPALAGLTPRQAAGDPTRREDLVRLLHSFESMPSGPGAMSPARLRAALRL